MRGATRSSRQPTQRPQDFNPRAPCGARRPKSLSCLYDISISTHAPLAGRDLYKRNFVTFEQTFQPTRPLRGATVCPSPISTSHRFQPTRIREYYYSGRISTHAPLAGRDNDVGVRPLGDGISTHAPLAGRDSPHLATSRRENRFQPTRPLRGATMRTNVCGTSLSFQPTRPLRGATSSDKDKDNKQSNFNPRAPCGARPPSVTGAINILYFNPRAPCGARPSKYPCMHRDKYFNPRAPCGARPGLYVDYCTLCSHFNPRAPCGARRRSAKHSAYPLIFQPTRPLRGATWRWIRRSRICWISTHAPLAGRDDLKAAGDGGYKEFQPTRPLRGATGFT